jgi:hypothetical protein
MQAVKIIVYFISLTVVSFITGSMGQAGEYEKLSDEQRDELNKGEPVYEYVKTSDDEGHATGGYARSLILVKKPIEDCWNIFSQVDKHHEYFPRQTETHMLDSDTTHALLKKVFDFYVKDISYYIKYTIDPGKHKINYDLDKSRPHDLEEVNGFFLFEEVKKDTTLFIYAVTRTETGLRVPKFIQNYITSRDLPNVTEHVKKRIESGGTWKK